MRIIDSVDHAAPVRGVYVVRSVVEACAGDPPQSSRGCGAWRVLAKVADVSAPVATPVPTPSPTMPAATPPTGYSVDRALTAAELAAVMAGPALPVNTTLVAAVTIDSSEAGAPGCVPTSDSSTIGLVHGMPTRVCVFGGGYSPARVPGIFAFRYLGPGALNLMAQITPASSSRPVFRATESWPWTISGDTTFLVGGYLVREPAGSRITDTPNGPAPSTNTYQTVQVDDTAGIDSSDPSRYGVFVVWCVPVYTPTDSIGSHGDGFAYHVVAQVGDIALPGASAPPSPSPSSGLVAPPATPIDTSLTGVIGTGDRPLSADELETLMVSRPDHLAGRVVIVEAPIPTQISCQSDANGGGCAVNTRSLAAEGDWAVRVGANGMLTLIRRVSTPGSGDFVFTLDQIAIDDYKDGDLLLVDAWLIFAPPSICDILDTPKPSVCDGSSLSPTDMTNQPNELPVQLGTYQAITGNAAYGPPVHGLFVVRMATGTVPTILARLEPATP
jgi:hypothetical protein